MIIHEMFIHCIHEYMMLIHEIHVLTSYIIHIYIKMCVCVCRYLCPAPKNSREDGLPKTVNFVFKVINT